MGRGSNMTSTAQSIIRTLAFYDAVGSIPLTKIELYKYLIKNGHTRFELSFGNFINALDSEWEFLSPYITKKRGFYFLKKNSAAYAKRVGEGKTGVKKWRIAVSMARLISFLPFVRMIGVTGSLALNSTTKNSDIDILIVVKRGHIWTTRVLVSMLTQVLGKRRYGKFIRDRICLNHYISDNESVLRPNHLFSEHICSTFVPVWKETSYDPIFSRNTPTHLKSICEKPNPIYIFRNFIEWSLSKTIATSLERALKSLQMRRIEEGTSRHLWVGTPTAASGFIADDDALVFHHPRPKNQEALYLYQQNLRHIKLS